MPVRHARAEEGEEAQHAEREEEDGVQPLPEAVHAWQACERFRCASAWASRDSETASEGRYETNHLIHVPLLLGARRNTCRNSVCSTWGTSPNINSSAHCDAIDVETRGQSRLLPTDNAEAAGPVHAEARRAARGLERQGGRGRADDDQQKQGRRRHVQLR